MDAISDALYSDSDCVLDSMTELLETLLNRHSHEMDKRESMSLLVNFMKVEHQTSPSSLHQFEDHINEENEQEDTILSELISAIGLQRFRFGERQSKGEYFDTFKF